MTGRRWLRRLGRFLLWTACLWFVGTTLFVLALRWINPTTSAVMIEDRITASIERDARFKYRYWWTSLANISPHMRVAVIASEDQKFPYHWGFDFDQIQTAIDEADDGRRQRGASTISQQVAKNLFLWQGHNFLRKGIEAYFTLLIEWLWPKERILEVYLNIAEFGRGVYGVGAASQFYYHMPAARLNRYQAALFAAVLPSPRRFRIEAPSNYVLRRRDFIADQMEGLGGPSYLLELRNPHPEQLAQIKKRHR